MRKQARVYAAVIFAWLAHSVGCGGQSSDTDAELGSDAGAAHDGRSDHAARVPAKHRAAAEPCDDRRDPGTGPSLLIAGEAECSGDADCTAGANGRCTDFRGLARCTYDECFADAACTSGGPCGCATAFWTDANSCLAGNCQTDGDCGAGGYCSPTFGDCGDYTGVIGYYCHTASDACIDDADCVDPTQGPGYCMYRPEVGHWACGHGQCVG